MKRNSDLEKQIQSYLKEIRRLLCCKPSIKREFLQRLQASIEDYLEDHPEAGMEDIVSVFGTPQAIAEEFIPDANISFKKDHLLKKKALIIAVILVILAAVSVIVCAAIISYNSNKNSNGYYEITITEEEPIIIE